MHMLRRTRRRAHRRGFALVLVLIAVAMAMALAIGFAAAQNTSVQLARNVDGQARSRLIAESALEMGIRYVDTNATWRADRPNGLWLADQAFDGGTFSLYGEDGEDTDGDGVVDGDGDLADSGLDTVTLTAVASYRGASYTAKVVVQPSKSLVMVVGNPSSLTSEDTARRSLLTGWGWNVLLLDNSASGSQFDAAVSGAHVIYYPSNTSVGSSVRNRLKTTPLPVVMANQYLPEDLGISRRNSWSYRHKSIDISGGWRGGRSRGRCGCRDDDDDDDDDDNDDLHYIVQPFGTGRLQILSERDRLVCLYGGVGSGF